jgi:very-short-patch-repair endonuclease
MAKLDKAETERLSGLYERLREKLLDLSKRNKMLNYKITEHSRTQLRIVDEVLEDVYKQLAGNEDRFRIMPLPEPEDIPADEKTDDFLNALAHGRVSDLDYIKAIDKLDRDEPGDEVKFERAEAALRLSVRQHLGLPNRPSRKEINRNEHARLHGINPAIELPAKAQKDTHKDKDLQTLKFSEDLDRTLDKIASGARLAEQEMGVSTLFLAFGFLERYESEDSETPYYAPLLLLPVSLEKDNKRGRDVFFVSAREGAAEANLSLQKLVEKDHKRKIPDFVVDEEGGIGSIEDYFDLVREAIDGEKRWNIRRWLVLGHFAFGRFAMYADLDPKNWRELPVSHGLVSSILSGTDSSGSTGDISLDAPPDYEIDRPEIEKEAPYLIQDADASQHSAIIDVVRGTNLVIQGPPGTGKSQTITNIIANALAKGKKVLFLSEKLAALEVVKRRLESAGLGEYCLELHSDKASPKSIIDNLRRRLKLGVNGKPSQPYADAAWRSSREIIGNYVSDLHEENKSGSKAFADIWKSIRSGADLKDANNATVSIKLPSEILDGDPSTTSLFSDLEIYASNAVAYSQLHGSLWTSVWRKTPIDTVDPTRLPELLAIFDELQSSMSEIETVLQLAEKYDVTTLDGLQKLVAANSILPKKPPVFHLEELKDFDPDDLEELSKVAVEASSTREELRLLPDLSTYSDTAVNALVDLRKMKLSEEMLSLTATGLSQSAQQGTEEIEGTIAALDGFAEVLRRLDQTEETSLSVCNEIVSLVIELSTVSPEWHAWYAQSKLDELAFAGLFQEWNGLLNDEQMWRAKFPKAAGVAWPAAESLRSASKALARSKIGKLLGVLSAESRETAATLKEIGESSIDPAVLLDLAKHVAALVKFENNPTGQATLSVDWAGLNTNFEDIELGLSTLQGIRRRLQSVSGLGIEHKYVSLIQSDPVSTARCVSACERLRIKCKGILDNSANISLRNFIDSSRHQLSELESIAKLDLATHFENLSSAVSQLLLAQRVRERNLAAGITLNSSPAGIALGKSIRVPSDLSEVQMAISWLQAMRRCEIPNSIMSLLKSSDSSAIRSDISLLAQQAAASLEKRESALDRLNRELGFGYLSNLDWHLLKTTLDAFRQSKSEAREHLQLRIEENHLRQSGLSSLLDHAISADMPPEKLPEVLIFAAASQRAQRAIRSSQTLIRSGTDLTSRRKQFVERDKEKIIADRKSLRAALSTSRPPNGTSSGSKKNWTELALLQNELNKEKRFVPARILLSKAGNAMQELLPCFMMSPLALAKFTASEALKFDILVIDEASQMRSEDALGGLLRSKQVVVVGDQKQLPPTDFFGRADGGGDTFDADDDLEDDESILENCRKTFRKVRRLNWHYRSKCESLIRFSNEHFYDKALITFPAPIKQSFAIDLVRVNGTCQSRRNPLEAAAITEQAVSFMHEHADLPLDEIPTIGIVAINSDQRDLIQEEFSRLTSGDARIEKYLVKAKGRNEEFFVKNLENVQGDERDYIFISMTYGPDTSASAMKQNFGPINRKQGHRRLNVLFSRARVRIGLFTSFGSEDVKPAEKSSEGVYALRNYLKYVEAMGQSLGTSTGLSADSDFEIEVARRLGAKGYATEPQVGVSGYRIDLGVLDPERPGQFLAGVECDGAAYHSSKSARDRDRLREAVLRGLGWTILRVWSTDWFDDPNRETEKLANKLQELRGQQRATGSPFRIGPSLPPRAEAEITQNSLLTSGASGVSPKPKDALTHSPGRKQAYERPSGGKQNGETASLLPFDTRSALINLREGVIRNEVPDWTLQRSILRDAMIETFVSQRMENAEDWFKKVPSYLRQATNPVEKKYLEDICQIVARTHG